MKSLQNLSYKTLFAILFFSIAGIIFFLKIGGKTQKVSAAWWDDSWHYRQAINISSHTTAESNVYIITSISIGSTTKAQADDGDFRFTDQNGNLLSYYISSGTGTTNVTFHIQFSIFPAGAQTIYAYYGNPSASNGFSASDFSTQASNYTIGSLSTEEIGGGPIAYWKFDEGVGTTAFDSTENNNGIINKATWSNQGISGKGLNFTPNQENLILNYKVWKVGQTGTITGFNSNGAANENYRVFDTDPWGRKVTVWEAITDVDSNADGGWDGSSFSIDNTKLYRFSVWVKRTVTGNGNFYLGTHGYGSINGIYNRGTGTTTTNPYFWVGTPSQGVWTLVVGHVWPKLSGTGAVHSDSGRYTISNGKIGAISSDFVWMEENTTSNHRSYLYYSTDTNTRQQWIYPRVDIVDGTEPSIQDLLDGHDSYGADVSATIQNTKESFSFWYDKHSTGNWQHIAKSSSDYYINGKLGTPDEYPIYIDGNDVFVGRTTDSDFVTGSIDEVKIYNYTLTANQIKQDYNSRGSLSGSSVNLGIRSNTAPSLKSSLVAYYKFDENNGTTVYDSSENNNFGNLSGVTWANGKYRTGVSFNGTNNVILIPDTNNTLDMPNDFTISFWVNPTSSGTKELIAKAQGGNYEIWQSNNNISVRVNGSSPVITGSNILVYNQWTHITVKYERSTGIVTIYKNGTYFTNGNNTNIASINNSSLQIGAYSDGTSYPFLGLIDEVKIYNRALTPEEIKQDYNQGSVVQFGTTNQTIGGTTTSLEYCIPGDVSYCAPPIAEWKMDEKTGNIVNDTSGNNKTGTLNNTYSWVQGKIGSAISFNTGSSANNMTSSPILSSTSGVLTLQAWVYPTSYGSGEMTVINGTGAYYLSVNNDGSINCYWYGTTPPGYHSSGAGTVPLNQWTHIVCSWDSTNIKLYTNGLLKNNIGVTGNGSVESSLNVGAESTSRQFKGKIDHVKIYNYARTPAQIAYDYNKGGPIGWWKFDECQGNIAYDWSGIGNTGVINIGSSGTQNSLSTCAVGTSAAWTNGATGKINSSLNFDGVDDYVNIGNQTELQMGTGAISVSHWIKLTGLTNYRMTFFGGGFGGATGYGIGFQSGTTTLRYETMGSSGGRQVFTVDGGITLNKWHHITGIFDGINNVMKLYVDGIQKHGIGISDPGTVTNNSNFSIGSYNASQEYFFNGQIDDVRIYNYPLTSEQVKTVYNNGAVNFN